jgi:hypothetical protein
MSTDNHYNQEFTEEDQKNYNKNGLRQYGIYSAIVFQMLATMGFSFWGGNKLNEYLELPNKLLTVAIGFLGMSLAFYNLLNQLKKVQNNENKK